MLENYHNCEKIRIGSSDIAALIAVGCGTEDLKTAAINYGEDGNYLAYICGGEIEIPSHYEKVFECRSWLKIYDDERLTFDSAKHGDFNRFEVYRAGNFGTIIRMWKEC